MKKRIMSAIIAVVMFLATLPAFAASAELEAFMASITAETITQHELAAFVTKNLVLPTAPDGITVTYSSSDKSAITNDGKVTRADIEDKAVAFTVTATDGTDTLSKEINLNVVANATSVFYQDNFAYPELIGEKYVVSSIGWMDQTVSKMEHSIKTDEDGNHYIFMDHASSGYPEAGPKFSAKGRKIKIDMDLSVDFTNGTTKIIDLWLGMVRGSTVDFPKIRLSPRANGTVDVGGMATLAAEGRTPLTIELDMENLTMRAKTTGDWSSSKAIPSANAAWTEFKCLLFRRGSGGSPAAVIEVDNMIVYEERDRATYADSLAVDKTMAVLDQAKMTDEDFTNITKNLNLNYAELQVANEANGTTVTFESSNPETIDDNGVVNRGFGKKDVTLTAIVSKGNFSASKKFMFTVAANEAAIEIENALAFSNMSKESNYAVTKDLNLSYNALLEIQSKYGAVVTMESSDSAVLEIRDGKGYIARGEEEGIATLSISAEVDGVTFSREHEIIVPAISTYVFKSEDFSYPELEGQRLSEIEGWVCETDPARFTTTIESNYGDYYIDGFLPEADGGTRRPAFTFRNDRDVDAVSVEFTATYNEDASVSAIYEFELYGGTTGSDLDSSNTIARIQTTGRSMLIYGHSEDSTAYYGKYICSATRAAVGKSDRYRFDFDFVNQGYNFYLNGTKINTELIPFKSGITYDSFKKFNFAAFRQSVGANILIDDFVIQARDVEFTSDYVSEAGQPLKLEVSFNDTNYADSVYMYVTSDYDEEYELCQLLKVNNAGDELIKNVIFDFLGAELIDKKSGEKKQMVKTLAADENPALWFSRTYLGGNHGVSYGVRVNSPSHGKTYADIGSVWEDDKGVKWTLVRVTNENELLFLSETTKDSMNNWNFTKDITGTTLIYDADFDNNFAANSANIEIASILETNVQVQPSIGNRSMTMYVYRDGECTVYNNVDSIREAFTINCSKVVLFEKHDIMDPSKIGYNLRLHRPEGGYTSPADIGNTGTPIMHYTRKTTVYEDGDVVEEFDHELLEDLRSVNYNGTQYYEKADVFGGGVYRYLPGVKDVEIDGVTYKFTEPYLMTDNYYPGYMAKKNTWTDPDYAPDRTTEYYRDVNGKNRMAYVHGFIPIGDAAYGVRKDNISDYAYVMYDRTGYKVYPMFADVQKFTVAGARFTGSSFRHYDNLDQSTDKVTAFDVEYNDDVYYYIDFMADEENFTLDLNQKSILADAELVYKSSDVTYTVEGNTLTVSGKKAGYLCIKAKRSAEICTVAYDEFTGKLGIWINNRSDGPIEGNIVIAGYSGEKFAYTDIISNAQIKESDFTRFDVNDLDSSITEIEVFLWTKDGLKPINKTKLVSVN